MAGRDTRAQVAHLFRRAGFGLRPEELDHFTRLGVQASVDYLINYDSVIDLADQHYPPPDMSAYLDAVLTFLKGKHLTAAQVLAIEKTVYQSTLALQQWWINRMMITTRPLQEKMTLFWHGHFATALEKSGPFMLQQNQLFRKMALSNFDALLKAVNQDVAMLLWLDGAENRKGKPNENFARELMELFTLGLGHYTEADVKEGARALTGWAFVPQPPFLSIYVPNFHDDGLKTYLGHTGNFAADDVMNILAAHPATGGFLARKIFTFFAYEDADGATIRPFTDTYYRSHYDVKAVVQQILLSDAFYSDRSFQAHIKSPIEFVIGTTRELGVTVPIPWMLQALNLMGQQLFNPPNVGGWPGGRTWITANALAARFNFAGWLTARLGPQIQNLDPQQILQQSGAQDAAGLIDYLLSRFIGIGATAATRSALLSYTGGAGALAPEAMDAKVRGLVQLVLGSPEYQLN